MNKQDSRRWEKNTHTTEEDEADESDNVDAEER